MSSNTRPQDSTSNSQNVTSSSSYVSYPRYAVTSALKRLASSTNVAKSNTPSSQSRSTSPTRDSSIDGLYESGGNGYTRSSQTDKDGAYSFSSRPSKPYKTPASTSSYKTYQNIMDMDMDEDESSSHMNHASDSDDMGDFVSGGEHSFEEDYDPDDPPPGPKPRATNSSSSSIPKSTSTLTSLPLSSQSSSLAFRPPIKQQSSSSTSTAKSWLRPPLASFHVSSLITGVTSLSTSASAPASYTPSPRRTPPPYSPPPLTPLQLEFPTSTSLSESSQILSRLLAEEIRLLLPARVQLSYTWNLVFSLERDGSSLSTLYESCEEHSSGIGGRRGGYVLVVQDGAGSVFGAYLTDPPKPSQGHYYGTGECFLWRSTVISSSTLPSLSNLNLPPLPSSDTTHATRMTTIGSPKSSRIRNNPWNDHDDDDRLKPPAFESGTGTSTPDERIRFKAFPYSGINDYMIFCEGAFLSVGGGDGHYGLWLDSSLERGVSQTCPTFGNEPLAEEGEKFEVIGVEVWHVGA